jgi:hypothetical protein
MTRALTPEMTILSLLFFLTKKVTKKSRQTRMAPPVLPAHAHKDPDDLEYFYWFEVKRARPCCLLSGNTEGAVFRLAISSIQ